VQRATPVVRESYRDLLRGLSIITLASETEWSRDREITLGW